VLVSSGNFVANVSFGRGLLLLTSDMADKNQNWEKDTKAKHNFQNISLYQSSISLVTLFAGCNRQLIAYIKL